MSPSPLWQVRIDQETTDKVDKVVVSRTEFMRQAIMEKIERDLTPSKLAKSKPKMPVKAKPKPKPPVVDSPIERCPHRTASVCEECAKEQDHG
jgi:hypothetical protein